MQRHPHVALVDDDEGMCRALTRLLHSVGIDVTTYRLGRSALRGLGGHPPDCAVVDIELPDFTALSLLKRIRSDFPRLPVILITAWEDDGLRRQALASGAVGFFYKPFGDEAFLACLRRALNESHPASGSGSNQISP